MPPHSSLCLFNDYMHKKMDVISHENKQSYILGDFNIDLLKG